MALREQGFIPRQEAAAEVGRADGGNIPVLFERYAVGRICFGPRDEKKWYYKADLAKVPKDRPPTVGGQNNGGKLFAMIADLRKRVEALEGFRKHLEGV